MTVTAVPAQKPRTSSDIQQEFNNLAFRAGHLQHDIWNKERDLKMFNDTLAGFEVEYKTVKQQEDAAAKAASEAAAAVPTEAPTAEAPAESTG